MPHDWLPRTRIRYFWVSMAEAQKRNACSPMREGEILARSIAGPSNPLRTGYTRAWFSLSEAADVVLSRQKIKA